VIILLYANVKVFVEKNKKQSGGGMVSVTNMGRPVQSSKTTLQVRILS
jgi:hypothetical protein